MTKKTVDCYDVSEIQEVTLLSVEEWDSAKQFCPKYSRWWWWWLRSPGCDSWFAVDVKDDGSINNCGDYVYFCSNGVRPAFKLNLESKIGDKIMIGQTVCTVISEDYALSDIVVCMHKFDAVSNDYETSEIKRFINSDEFKEML